MELEKVINGLKEMLEESKYNDSVNWNPWADTETLEAAIALLKVQEPRDAIVVPNGIDRSGSWWYQCPSCKMEIKPRDRYCRSCGQAVKWE